MDDLDVLLNELTTKPQTTLVPIVSAIPEEKITDDNMNQYIIDKMKKLIDGGLYTVESLKEMILASGEARNIESYAELYKGVVGAVDTLTKINLQNKKERAAKEMKQMEIKAKLENPDVKNTNILVATREDIFNKFIEKNKKTIDIEPENAKYEK